MPQPIDKKKKLFIYFFLLILLTTTNNFSLTNSKYLKLKISQIKVSGLSNENNFNISKEFTKLIYQKNLFFINKDYFVSVLEKNNLIHSFKVRKIYPNTIEIQIEKTKLLAVTNYKEKNFFIGANGKLINFQSTDQNLPYIFGKIKIEEFINFKKIVDNSKFNFEEISELFFFSSGRWDIKIHNGILIKLPKKNLLKALNLGNQMANSNNFKNNKVIDLRIYNNFISTSE